MRDWHAPFAHTVKCWDFLEEIGVVRAILEQKEELGEDRSFRKNDGSASLEVEFSLCCLKTSAQS